MFLTCCLQCPKTSKAGFSQHCVSASANFLSRILFPNSVREVAEAHERILWECVSTLLNFRDTKTSRHGTRPPFHCPWDNWACWEDCLPCSSFDICKKIFKKLDGQEMTSCTSATSRMARDLVGVGGLEQRSWISPFRSDFELLQSSQHGQTIFRLGHLHAAVGQCLAPQNSRLFALLGMHRTRRNCPSPINDCSTQLSKN